jgi:hypothetical protein
VRRTMQRAVSPLIFMYFKNYVVMVNLQTKVDA